MDKNFGLRLKKAIRDSGKLVKEVSKDTGINKRTIDKWIGSKPTTPGVFDAVEIARSLGMTVEELVSGEPSARIGADDFRLLQKAKAYRQFLDDLDALDPDVRAQFVALVRVAAEAARAAGRRDADDDAPPFRLTPDEAAAVERGRRIPGAVAGGKPVAPDAESEAKAT